MSLVNRVRSWWRGIFQRSRVQNEMEAELGFHVEAHAEDLMQSGVTRAEALRRARLEFGGMEGKKEECLEARGASFVDNLIQDLRYGARTMLRAPGFTAMAVLALALGIGAGALLLSRVMRGQLFGVQPTDPATFVAGACGLMIVVLAASYIPARRAMRVDPMVALRYE